MGFVRASSPLLSIVVRKLPAPRMKNVLILTISLANVLFGARPIVTVPRGWPVVKGSAFMEPDPHIVVLKQNARSPVLMVMAQGEYVTKEYCLMIALLIATAIKG